MTVYSSNFSVTGKETITTASVVIVSSVLADPIQWFTRNYLNRAKIELGFNGDVELSLTSTSSVGSRWTYTFVLVDRATII